MTVDDESVAESAKKPRRSKGLRKGKKPVHERDIRLVSMRERERERVLLQPVTPKGFLT